MMYRVLIMVKYLDSPTIHRIVKRISCTYLDFVMLHVYLFIYLFLFKKRFSFINLYSIPINNLMFCYDIWTSAGIGRLSRRNSRDLNNEKLIQRTQDLRLGQRFTFQQVNNANTRAAETPGCAGPPMVPVQPAEALEDLQRGMSGDPGGCNWSQRTFNTVLGKGFNQLTYQILYLVYLSGVLSADW